MRLADVLARTAGERRMLVFLAFDLAIFVSLLAWYIHARQAAISWPQAFHFPSAVMAFAMTMFAVAASVTTFVAVNHRDDPDPVIAVRCFVATIFLWGSFLFVDAFEWGRLLFLEDDAVHHHPAFGATFFALSGYQVMHVLVCVACLMLLARFPRKTGGPALGLFTHFTTLVWLVLFPAIYLASADLQGF